MYNKVEGNSTTVRLTQRAKDAQPGYEVSSALLA